jgi:hypothetical protein
MAEGQMDGSGQEEFCGSGKELGFRAGHLWLMPVILATQETEIRRMTIQSQHGEIVRDLI